MTITKKGETPVKESSLLASPEPITMYLLLWNIFQYCTGAMSRGRLIGLITAVFTPFGLYTIINQILIASNDNIRAKQEGKRCRSWLVSVLWSMLGKGTPLQPQKSKKNPLL